MLGEQWCLGADFNTVYFEEERIGRKGGTIDKGSEEFREFLNDMEVINILAARSKYTW